MNSLGLADCPSRVALAPPAVCPPCLPLPLNHWASLSQGPTKFGCGRLHLTSGKDHVARPLRALVSPPGEMVRWSLRQMMLAPLPTPVLLSLWGGMLGPGPPSLPERKAESRDGSLGGIRGVELDARSGVLPAPVNSGKRRQSAGWGWGPQGVSLPVSLRQAFHPKEEPRLWDRRESQLSILRWSLPVCVSGTSGLAGTCLVSV